MHNLRRTQVAIRILNQNQAKKDKGAGLCASYYQQDAWISHANLRRSRWLL